MGEYTDKAKGAANKAIGSAKIAIGQQMNEAGLIVDGLEQKTKGKVQSAVGAAKGKLKNRF